MEAMRTAKLENPTASQIKVSGGKYIMMIGKQLPNV